MREASRLVGKRPSSAYRLRDHANGAGFRADWARVIEGVTERVRETVLDRAFTGHSVPVFHRGNHVGDKTVFNDGLLIALMRYYDAPAYRAGLVRDAEATTLLAPPRHRAELLVRFEGAPEKCWQAPRRMTQRRRRSTTKTGCRRPRLLQAPVAESRKNAQVFDFM